MAELEAVVTRLEQGDVPLEEALKAFETRHRADAFLPARADTGRAEGRAADERVPTASSAPCPSMRRRSTTSRSEPGRFAARLAAYQTRVETRAGGAAAARRARAERLHAAMRYSALGGGKRIRPALVYATGELLGVALERARCRGRGGRDDPRLLAGPRRPAGDGRRRPAPRPADLPPRSSTRRPRSSPATRCRCWRSRACADARRRRAAARVAMIAAAGRRQRHARHGRRPGDRSRRGRPRRSAPPSSSSCTCARPAR